jgi:hypothetical protein
MLTRTSIVYSLGDAINNNQSMANTVAVGERSAFVRSGWKNPATITDGTSNTIAASETKVSTDSDNRETSLASMNGVGSTLELETDPRQCLDHLDSNNKKFYKSTHISE